MMRPRLKSLPWSSKKDFVELTIPLLSSYAVGVSRALVHIEIGRQDHWRSVGNGQGRELTVLRAALQGTVQHRGVRYAGAGRLPVSSVLMYNTEVYLAASLSSQPLLHPARSLPSPPWSSASSCFPRHHCSLAITLRSKQLWFRSESCKTRSRYGGARQSARAE
jgi:hypothetical protein